MNVMKTDDARIELIEKTSDAGDLDIEWVASEVEDYESGPGEYQISSYPADYTLEVLNAKWLAGDVEIPKFQRQFVWKQVQASKLIESFLAGLPVPAIYLYTERDSQKYLVVDGQQRLKSVFYFFEGLFGEEVKGKRTTFRLKGLNEKSRWTGKSFEELDEADQRRLKNAVLRAVIIQQFDPGDDTSMYHIFERLNTGGTFLTNQEIRNCVYRGELNDLLVNLNTYASWREILGKSNPDSRQKDIELILRFFSLFKVEDYQKPLKDYLSRFMRRNRSLPKEVLEGFSKRFHRTCDTVFEKLGEKPFHLKKGLNAAALDSVMVAFAKHLDAVGADIRQRFESLVAKDQFQKLISDATTDVDTVKQRFQLAERVLFP